MQQTQERAKTEVVVRPGAYSTILVHAEPAGAATERVEAAAALARDLDARLIGLGAETFDPFPTTDPFTGMSAGEWVALVQEQMTKDLGSAEAAFLRDAAGADVEWRQAQAYPHEAIAQAAAAADLIVVSPRKHHDRARDLDPADVVMSSGRPVLVVPPGRRTLRGAAVVVAWKNTRECRRAVADAMPFLLRADDVIVLAACAKGATAAIKAELDDVVASLKRRGVKARPMVTDLHDLDAYRAVVQTAKANGADLIVAGAYGHSRLREWAFGGVTDEFIHRPECFVLMSH